MNPVDTMVFEDAETKDETVIIVKAEARVSGSVSLTYSYNAFGERVSQSDGMTTTQFVYDAEEGDLLGEFNGSGSLTARYLCSDLDAVVRGGVTTWYHLDATGSTRLLTNSAGAVTDCSRSWHWEQRRWLHLMFSSGCLR